MANIKLETEFIKMQINSQIERIKTQNTENVKEIETQIIEENVTQIENKAIEEKSSDKKDLNPIKSGQHLAESIPQTKHSSSLFGLKLFSPQKTTPKSPLSSESGFCFGKEFAKTSETTSASKDNDFSIGSLFGKSSANEMAHNSKADSIFGNFGQNSNNRNDFPFNFKNNSNESIRSNSPLLWK